MVVKVFTPRNGIPIFCLIILTAANLFAAENRHALLVAIDDYEALPKISATEDIDSLSLTLRGAKFEVTQSLNPTLAEMRSALNSFNSRISPGDIAFLYFGGHGIQVGGANYLIPQDFAERGDSQIRSKAVPLQELLDQLSSAKPNLKIVAIDACRNNPLSRSSGGDGLAELHASPALAGTFLAFSASPGRPSFDGVRFAKILATEIAKPGLDLTSVFNNVKSAALVASARQQFPWVTDLRTSETKAFHFTPPARKGIEAMSLNELHSEIDRLLDRASVLRLQVESTKRILGQEHSLNPKIQQSYEKLLRLLSDSSTIQKSSDRDVCATFARQLDAVSAALGEYYENQ